MAIAAAIIATVFITFFIYYLTKHIKLWRLINKIHGPAPYWIVGNALHIKIDAYDWQEQTAGCTELWTNPRMFRLWFFNTPYVMLNGPTEAAPILSSSKHVVKSSDYEFLRPWLGKGLFVNGGEPWRPQRKMMTPAFHGDVLRDFVPVFNRQGRIFVSRLAKNVDKGPTDIFRYCSFYALSVLWESVMGTDMNIQLGGNKEYVQALIRIGDLVFERQRQPWFWPDFVFYTFGSGKEHDECIRIVHGTIEKVINKRLREINGEAKDENENAIKDDIENYTTRDGFIILDYWLEQMKKGLLTMKEVKDEANTFLFGGYDTTGTSSCWVLYFIGYYPHVQAKVHEELDDIFGKDKDRDVTLDDVKRMVYLECCIKEALRLYPPVPIIGRRIAEDVVTAGRRIPAGTQVLVNAYAIHRDPEHWENPEQYMPERFLPENSVGRHSFAYIPFSAGVRNCIAQRFAMLEEKVVLSTVFRRFKLRSVERPDQVRAKPDLVLRPCRALVEITERP